MQLKLTLLRPGHPEGHDILVDADPTATVGALARALAERDPNKAVHGPVGELTLRAQSSAGDQTLDPAVALGDAPLRSGDEVALVAEGGQFVDAAHQRASAASLLIRQGLGEGDRIQLRAGANQVGRDAGNDVVLRDPMVSKRHARFNVTDVVEVLDLGSVNGVEVGGQPVQRAILRPGDTVLLGDTLLAVETVRATASAARPGPTEAFNRSPYLDPVYEGHTFKAPDPPRRPQPPRFPMVAMAAPLVFASVMYFAMPDRPLISLLFMALSPLMMVGMWLDGRRQAKRALIDGRRQYASALDLLTSKLTNARGDEAARRRQEHPSAAQVLAAADGRSPMLWARRPDRHGYGELRLGLAAMPSRTTVEMPTANDAIPELWEDLVGVVDRFRLVPDVPVVARLADVGVVGVTGVGEPARATARGLLVQLAGLHSPTELVLGGMFASENAAEWDWLKWLPHTTSDHSPLECRLLGSGAESAAQLSSALVGLLAQRSGTEDDGQRDGDWSPQVGGAPVVVVVVDDSVPLDRSILVDLAERGPSLGVHLLWVAPTVDALPAAACAFVAHDVAAGTAMAGFIDDGQAVQPVTHEGVDAATALSFARALSAVVDVGSRLDAASDVPDRVSFLDQVGQELAELPAAVVERWRTGDSLPTPGVLPRPRRRPAPLNALVGAGAHGPLQLDLRSHGPHALVGGTTGAGKSEFLQSWIMGLAVNHSPNRVTFLFVDYKGGAAFSECVNLPHCVGLVTDLTPHLVQRALTSLNAELRHREHVLNRRKAKDVLELERLHDPECPPSLVIVVDEFAALVSEVPEFVDGVVNVAQRGRSLGLHLVLATQRPAGVIKDNLRANTNLRVALRMSDASDSQDVVASKVAADFDPATPGRAVAKLGPGALHPFQAAYVGGWTTGTPPLPSISISSYSARGSEEWPEPVQAELPAGVDMGPTDLVRLVESVTAAARSANVSPPRKPWLGELAATYDLGRPPSSADDVRLLSRTDERLVFGVLDDPANQAQRAVAFTPDVDGNLAVLGAGGSGKTTFLRTLAIAAALSTRGGPCHVYALDFAGRGLSILEPLPNVGAVINADDEERTTRLLRTLRATINERTIRYASHKAGSVSEYRAASGDQDEPRILVLVDGYQSFRQEYEVGIHPLHDLLQSIAAEGRQVGVHVVVAVDRAAAIPATLSAVIQKRVILRQANENEMVMVGLRPEVLPQDSPPGRGICEGYEVQVAVLGGSPNITAQAEAIVTLAAAAAAAPNERPPAADVGALSEEVKLGELPAAKDGQPVIGVADDDLAPFAPIMEGSLLVVGPVRSGKTTAMSTIAQALRRARSDIVLWYVGEDRSALSQAVAWDLLIAADDDLDIRLAEAATSMAAEVDRAPHALFIERIDVLAAGLADQPLTDLITRFLRQGFPVVADADAEQARSGWGALKAVRANRHGLALMPEQMDGDMVFRTPFPRINRRHYPPGRAIYVRDGKLRKVQIAQPALEAGGESSPLSR